MPEEFSLNYNQKEEKKWLSQKKGVINGILYNYMNIFDNLRLYDKIRIVEVDSVLIVKKVLKLSAVDKDYFKIFKRILEEIVFIHDIQNQLKMSLFYKLKVWFHNEKSLKYPG
mmetsp:Transcript_6803/g.10961  ORF Transcript_6803/g.10961 Transcript_6803/m.10961 type:complete len:113 (-) Transcript_6803:2241-2579(-)